MSRTLVLLVGGNPLPNYLAARILATERPWVRAVLVYTKETEAVKDRLCHALSELGTVDERFVEDAASAESIRAAWRDLPPPVHLHYTGGTKAMAAHLHARWREEFSDVDWKREASYLDERTEALRFDDGTSVALAGLDLQLELEPLAGLHGLEDLERGTPKPGGPELPGDTLAMARSLLADPGQASRLYRALPEKVGRWRPEDPDELRCFGIRGLSHDLVPGQAWSRPAKEEWHRFLRGGWLEHWLGDLIRPLIAPHPVWVDVRARIKGRPFQVDVVALRRHRVYAVSCTTDATPAGAKSKLFEVAFRARQLGGDLARSALVCFVEEKLSDVQKDVEAGWDATNVPRPFGLQHLREWLAGRTDGLARWLET